MQLFDDQQLVYSASDLTGFVACPRLTWLALRVARDDLPRPPKDANGSGGLAARKGIEHERDQLASLRAAGLDIVEIDARHGAAGTRESTRATEAAMRAGADVIYQAVFCDGGWLGHVDFLARVERPSALGSWSYEARDTKLARHVKPYFVVQLCLYSELLAGVQGADPEFIEIVLGDNRRERLRLRDFDAYVRRIRNRFLAGLNVTSEPYPDSVEHCALCEWDPACEARRVADDHLSQVAGMRRDQIVKLTDHGVGTLAALAASPSRPAGLRIGEETYNRLHGQAEAQLRERVSANPFFELLKPEPRRGFGLLPPRSPTDVFFDMEGDPYYDAQGLEYLFGVEYADAGAWTFRAFWGTSPQQERVAFEAFIDWVIARWRRHPELHIYHYAHYEPTALKRLAGQHGTREEEVDELLSHGVFVDLYAVVRHAVRVGRPSYSIKELEGLYRDAKRQTVVGEGGESIEVFEEWLQTGQQSLLDAIEEYNADDCRSTRELRDWLLCRRADATERFGVSYPYEPPDPHDRDEDQQAIDAETRALIERLTADVPDDAEQRDREHQGRWLLAQLLDYHRREGRAVWWRFFALCDMDHEQLLDDLEAISGLEPIGTAEVINQQGSTTQWFSFPPQEFKFGPGTVKDPDTKEDAGEILDIDVANRRLLLKRTPKLADAPLPQAVFPFQIYTDKEHRRALRDLARTVLDHGFDGDGARAAARWLILGGAPRVRGTEPSGSLYTGELSLAQMQDIATRLDRSPLFIQGPPGSGKTYRGARVIVDLLRRGKRVGITSNSHRAISKLLNAVDKASLETGVEVRAMKKFTSADQRYVSLRQPEAFKNTTSNEACESKELNLVAGTSWLFVRERMQAEPLDYLFVDEAGQMALANVAAVAGAGENLVLLGDPQQLAQVSQAYHPGDAGGSVLEHLLGDRSTIPREEGLFLEQSWRMHPQICAFISDLAYDGRLQPAPGAGRRRIESNGLNGAGLRYIPIEHAGNRQSAPEEAARISEEIELLLADGWVTDAQGERRPLIADDVLVVAAYNHQVSCLSEHIRDDVVVGTVDKFQGQEAPVVFYSLATSAPEDAPRGIDFLFSRNRLNVAISRAQCIAALVGNPALLDADCRTVEQMRLVNGACRYVELASV